MQTQTQIYGVVLPVHIAQRARIVAAMNGKSRSSLMRDLLLDYLKRCEGEGGPTYSAITQPVTSKHKKDSKNRTKEN